MEYEQITEPKLVEELKSGRMKDKLLDNLYALLAAFVAMLFTSLCFFRIEIRSPKEWFNISLWSVASFVLGQSVKTLLRMHGIRKGRKKTEVAEAEERHRGLVQTVVVNIIRCDAWCQRKNAELRAQQRAVVLAAEGMAYDDYFDETGAAKPVNFSLKQGKLSRSDKLYNKVIKRRMAAYERAVKLTRATLSAAMLQGHSATDDPYKVGRDVTSYLLDETRRGILSTFGVSISTAIFAAQLVQNPDWGNVFMIVGQVIVYLILGAVASAQAEAYMSGEYRQRLVKLANLIEMFKAEESIS